MILRRTTFLLSIYKERDAWFGGKSFQSSFIGGAYTEYGGWHNSNLWTQLTPSYKLFLVWIYSNSKSEPELCRNCTEISSIKNRSDLKKRIQECISRLVFTMLSLLSVALLPRGPTADKSWSSCNYVDISSHVAINTKSPCSFSNFHFPSLKLPPAPRIYPVGRCPPLVRTLDYILCTAAQCLSMKESFSWLLGLLLSSWSETGAPSIG